MHDEEEGQRKDGHERKREIVQRMADCNPPVAAGRSASSAAAIAPIRSRRSRMMAMPRSVFDDGQRGLDPLRPAKPDGLLQLGELRRDGLLDAVQVVSPNLVADGDLPQTIDRLADRRDRLVVWLEVAFVAREEIPTLPGLGISRFDSTASSPTITSWVCATAREFSESSAGSRK